VGLYLVQLARHRGHRTVNVVQRKDAAAVVHEAGGDVVLVDGEDLAKRVTEVTGGAEVRLGIDAVAGTATGRLAGCLCEGADTGQLWPDER
jgi:mitochondrial enoyl-[acyl-carrier protein] reductase / trans-2-enoyl-CoA reductase